MSLRLWSEDSRLRLILAVMCAGFATFVNMYCTQSILPVLAKAFNVSPLLTGLTITAPLLATALIAPVAGLISDRFGRKRLICAAGVIVAIAGIFAASSQSMTALVAWRFTQGLFLPFIFTVTIAYIGGETSGADTVKLAANYLSGTILGGFSGRLVTGFATAAFGWRPAMYIVAFITLLAIIAVFILLPKERNFTPVRGLRNALAYFPVHLSNKRLLANNAIGFGLLYCIVAMFTFIDFRLAAPPYFLGPAALGLVFLVYLGGVCGTPIGARLTAKFGRRPVTIVATFCAFAGLLLTLSSSLTVIVAGLAITTTSIFIEQTIATAFVSVTAQEAKSTAVGLYITSYYIGGSAGGITPGPIYHLFGWAGCALLIGIVQLVMLALALKYWRPLRSGTQPAVP